MQSNTNRTNQGRRQVHRMNSLQQQGVGRQQADLKKIVQNYEFWLGNIIAKNQSSQVYSGIDINTQRPVAIKVIPIDKSSTSKQRYEMQNEIKLSRTIPKHKNIITVFDTFGTANNYYMMMEKVSIDLKALLLTKKTLSQEEVVPIMLDVLQGLRHLELNGLLHCNIKPSNILISSDGTAKITDFALMRKSTQQQRPPAFEPNQWTPYMHYLTLLTKTYVENNDLWSLAVMVYECLHGYHNFPWKFDNYTDLLQKISDYNIQFSSRVSKEMRDFLNKLFNPSSKMTVLDVFKDPFIINLLLKRNSPLELPNIEQLNQPKLLKNFTNNISPQRPNEQNPFLKFSAQLPQQNKIVITAKNNYQNMDFNYPQNQVKRHASNHETSSSPQKINLRNQITFVQNDQRKISPKDIIDCQFSFMRFTNIVLKQDENGYIPQKKDINADQKTKQIQEKKQVDHLLFRFVLIKQTLGQKDWLKKTLDVYHSQNPFNIDGIDEFLARYENKEVINNFRKMVGDYDRKYLPLEEQMVRLITQITSRLSKMKCEWRPRDILNPGLQRKEIIPILGVRLSRELCKHIWHQVKNLFTHLEMKGQMNEMQRNQIIGLMEEKARRVDFLMTYYILNCLLIDDFASSEYFVKNSKLNIIMNNKPIKMQLDDFKLVEDKLRLLQII